MLSLFLLLLLQLRTSLASFIAHVSHVPNCDIIIEEIILPAYIALIDNPIFDNIFSAIV